jgi:apurinic endonuclease APN1
MSDHQGININYLIGHHLSFTRKDPAPTFANANKLHNTVCAIFLKGQYAHSTLDFTESEIFKFKLAQNGMRVYPHACYTMNFLSDDFQKYTNALKSLKCEASLCEQLNITDVNVHPGNTNNHISETYQQLADCIRMTNEEYPSVRIIVENMTGGTKGCSSMEQMGILNELCTGLNYGFCLDTCHLWAAGYDVRDNMESVIEEFDSAVGRRHLSLMHFNGSKTDLNSKVDRHANLLADDCYITGCFCPEEVYQSSSACECGESFLKYMMNDLKDVPKIFEPPKNSDKSPNVLDNIPLLLKRLS